MIIMPSTTGGFRSRMLTNVKSLSFDGVNDNGVISNANGSGQFDFYGASNDIAGSLVFWVKVPTFGASETLMSRGDSYTTNSWWLLVTSTGQLFFRLVDTNPTPTGDVNIQIVTTDVLTVNTWHHIAITYDGSGADTGLNVYIDGTVDSSPTRSTTGSYSKVQSHSTNFSIGRRQGSVYGEAFLDELAFFRNRELTASEIASIYDAQSSGTTLNLLENYDNYTSKDYVEGYWGEPDGGGDWEDRTTNGRTIILNGATKVTDIP